ncbi:AsmA-like C-terminal region-containing protein [Zwartia sp. IMCC34845]|nr:AsmA-like C-terminal region-containing protein [Zwartia vadi]MDN3988398.1 AsmA-like C-terminal region-containing protein [Zwartia vadi]
MMLGVRYLVLPHIDSWRPQIEKRLSNALGAQVTMGEIAASWSGLNPTLALENLRLRDFKSNSELLYVPDAFAVVSWRSIFALDLRLRQLEINGIHLSGSRRLDGRIVMAGTVLAEQTDEKFNFSTETPAVRWLLNQGEIVVRDASFHWDDHFRGAESLSLTGIEFKISNSLFRHQLRLSANLPHKLGESLELIIRTDSLFNPLASHEQGDVEIYIEVNDAQPSAWSPWVDVPTVDGRFATRLWMTMSSGHFGRATMDLAGAHAAVYLGEGDATVLRADSLQLRWSGWLGDLLPDKKWLIFDRSPNELGASLTLSGQGLILDSKMFEPSALVIGDVSANTQWNRNARQQLTLNATRISLSGPTNAELRGLWTQGPEGSPGVVDVTGTLNSLDPTKLYQYATTEVTAETREWLRRAILSGSLKQVNLTLQGDLAKFPFNAPGKEAGIFRLEGQLDQVLLDYDFVEPNQPQWPAVTIVNGDLVLDKLVLTIKSDQAELRGVPGKPIQLSGLEIKAPDLWFNPNISIRLHSYGLAQEYLSTLSRTPIAHDFGKSLETLQLKGQASMPVAVDFDLEKQQAVMVNGQLKLTDVSAALSKDGIPVDKINGAIDFTDNTLVVKEMRGVALGGGVSLTGEWGPVKRQFSLRGEATTIASEKHQKLSAMLAVTGRTNYRADIKGNDKGGFELDVSSTLEGLTIKLPSPLGKSAGQKRPLSLKMFSTNQGKADRTALTFSVGNLNGRFEHDPNGRGQPYFSRGSIVMGGPATLPAAGLSVNLGFDRVNWDDWKALTDQLTALPNQTAAASGPAVFPPLHQLRLRSPEFVFAELTLNQLDLMLSRTAAQKWAARLESKQTQGVASWTTSPKGLVGPVVARFSRLSVGTEGGAAGEPPKTEVIDEKQWSSMPAIDLTVEDFTLYGSRLGALHLVGENVDNGSRWTIKQLDITNPHASMIAKGSWLLKGQERGVSLDGEIKLLNLGKLSDQMGYENRAAEGEGTIKAKINWLNFPWVFSYAGLNGEANIDLKNGVFQHVNSRSARLLEVLSLQSLQRILSLNFRTGEEFKDGFPWNSISGDLTLNQGVVNTTDLVVRSPIARISLTGGSDLNRKVWDLNADVRPILDMSGAAVATAFVVNPIAGLSALVSQFLLRNPIERAMSAKYQVKGTWDEPELIPVGVPTPVPDQPVIGG